MEASTGLTNKSRFQNVAENPSFTDIIYRSQLILLYKLLLNKYADYLENPETHKKFNRYRERYDKHHKQKGTRWSEYWRLKMEIEIDDECEDEKRNIWVAMKETTANVYINPAKTSVKTEVFDKFSSLGRSSSSRDVTEFSKSVVNISKNIETVEHKKVSADEVKAPTVAGRSDTASQTIPLTRELMPDLLKEFSLKVRNIIGQTDQEFKGYKDNLNSYPSIFKEKEDFLADMMGLKPSQKDYVKMVLEFDKSFHDHWLKRLQTLQDDKINAKIAEILNNWRTLMLEFEPATSTSIGDSLKRKTEEKDETLKKLLKLEIQDIQGIEEKSSNTQRAETTGRSEMVQVDESTMTIGNNEAEAADDVQPGFIMVPIDTVRDMKYLLSWLQSLTPQEEQVFLSLLIDSYPNDRELLESFFNSKETDGLSFETRHQSYVVSNDESESDDCPSVKTVEKTSLNRLPVTARKPQI